MVLKFQKQLRWIDVGLGFQKDTRLKKVMVGRNVLPVFLFSFFFFLFGITMKSFIEKASIGIRAAT